MWFLSQMHTVLADKWSRILQISLANNEKKKSLRIASALNYFQSWFTCQKFTLHLAIISSLCTSDLATLKSQKIAFLSRAEQ